MNIKTRLTVTLVLVAQRRTLDFRSKRSLCYSVVSFCRLSVCNVYIVAKRCILPKNSVKKIGNGLRGIELSRDRWRHHDYDHVAVILTPIRLEPNISRTAGDAI